MKAADIRLDELLSFSEGRIDLQGRRLVLHSADAFAQFRKDLFEMVGPEQTRRILTRFGYFCGNADAAAMKRVFKWKDVVELIKAGPRMHELQGVARPVVKSLDVDAEAGRFHMEVAWHDSVEAEEHKMQLGKSDCPACWKLVGYASGYATFCLGREVYFVEHKCRAMGSRVCTVVGKDVESWGKELEPHLAYFQADDIRRRIDKLTEQLKRATRELARHRKKLDILEKPSLEVRSDSFRRVLALAAQVAPFDSSVLITGESGVGKEVVARHIHENSRRSKGPFVAVNCGALPDTLLESELFGHKAGAFTGAVRDRVGLFEQAQGGTILLDEIGDVSDAMQVKLLRVLQEREIMRVGESRTRKIDVRVMAATHRNLAEAMRSGAFRDDLYYRLRVIEITIPPLRERKDDILPLARFFAQRLSEKLDMPNLRLDAKSLDYLLAHPWPGNVRELENAIEHAAVLSRNGLVLPEFLPGEIVRATGAPPAVGDPVRRTLAEVARDHIAAVLEFTDGNKSRAAKILGISPATLWRKQKRMEQD